MKSVKTRSTQVRLWWFIFAGLLTACSAAPVETVTTRAVNPPAQAETAAPQTTQTSAAFLPLQSSNRAATEASAAPPVSGSPGSGVQATAFPEAAAPEGGQTAPVRPSPADPAAPRAVVRPEAARRLLHTHLGYALHFPTEYDVAIYAEDGLTLMVESLLNTEAPRLDVQVQPAEGQTLTAAVERFIAEHPGFELVRTEIALGGEPAIVLDRVPGQEMTRIILAIHNDRLYLLRFTPADPARGSAFQEMELLYQVVTASFVFDPEP